MTLMDKGDTTRDVRVAGTRERLDAATPGPWWATEALDDDDDAAFGVATQEPDGAQYATTVTTPGSASFDSGLETERVADATLTAHAPGDLRFLLECWEEAREVIADAHHMATNLAAMDRKGWSPSGMSEYASALVDRLGAFLEGDRP